MIKSEERSEWTRACDELMWAPKLRSYKYTLQNYYYSYLRDQHQWNTWTFSHLMNVWGEGGQSQILLWMMSLLDARNMIHSYTKEKEPTEKHKIFMLLFMRFVFVRPLIRKILIKNIIPKTVIGYRISSSSCMAMLFFLWMPMVVQHRKLKLRSRIGNLLRQIVCFGWGRELEFTLYRAHWHRNQRPNLDNDSIKNGHCH